MASEPPAATPEAKIARINPRKALRDGAIVLLDDTINFEQGALGSEYENG